MALAASGETPWQWGYRPQDIVAQRVFGDAQADFADDCLLVTSRGQPFEIGLRLERNIPLRDFPRLRLFAFANAAAQVQPVVRERLDGGAWTSAPFPLAGISTATNIDMEKFEWRTPDGMAIRQPEVAAMLRLRFTLPQGATLQFNGATLDRPVQYEPLELTHPIVLAQPGESAAPGVIPIYRVPDTGFGAAQIAGLAKLGAPILAIPQTRRVEQQRLMFDTILHALPAAVVVPQNALDATFALARTPTTRSGIADIPVALRWTALIAFAAVLLFARIFPPRQPRVRAALEIVLVLAAPFWLVVGGHFTGEVGADQKFLIASVGAYAVTLGFPRDWKWNGGTRAWLLAAAVVALAAGIGIAAHFSGDVSIRSIGAAHVWRYLGWALIQQYLVCVVCTSRWKLVTGSTVLALYFGALGFALMHTPNAGLMLATFFGGLCWCALYLRERALLPLAFSHAASALVLIALLPPDWLYSAEVSARFFQ